MAINVPIITKFDNKGLQAAEQKLAGFAKAAGKIAAGATAAVGAIGAVSVKAFADFDAELTKSLAIMGDVSEALRTDMSNAAREVARTTTFNANQAAESFFFLASAGLDATASIQAMPKVAQFAQAGMFDMALATDLLTDAQSALGLTIRDDAIKNMENMVRVSDVLVKANTLANASVEQFSTALTTKAGASLRAVGKDVEEGVAVLAAFADQGIKGELAGTQLSIVLRDLTTKAINNRGAFKAMGIEVFDSAGEMANLGDIIGDLETALGGMSDETQKATLLQLGFSDKSLGSLQALMGTSEAIKMYERELRNASGTTDEVANKQLQTFNAQLELLKSRVQDAGITIGEQLAPTILQLVEGLGPAIDQAVPAFVELFQELAPVLAEVIGQLPQFLDALTPLIQPLGDIVILTLELVNAALPAIAQVIEDVSPYLQGLTDLLATNGETIGAVIVALGLFVITTRIASAALGILAGANATAAGSASGFFAVLARNPFVAITAAILGSATALFVFRDEIRESGRAGEIFLEGWARVTYGIQWFTRTMVNGALQAIELLHTGIRMVIEAVTNDVRRLGGLPPITLPALKLPRLEITPLQEYRRELGLLGDETQKLAESPQVAAARAAANAYANQARISANQYANAARFAARDFLTPQQLGPGTSMFYSLNQPAMNLMAGYDVGNRALYDPTMARQAVSQNVYNINVNAGLGVNGQRVGDDVLSIIQRYEEEVGPVFQRVRYTG